MKQTAVEWLYEELWKQTDFSLPNNLLEQANKMFEEQIIQAAQYEPFLGDLPRTEGEHYFEKTFKK
jgi:hypothetical protein